MLKEEFGEYCSIPELTPERLSLAVSFLHSRAMRRLEYESSHRKTLVIVLDSKITCVIDTDGKIKVTSLTMLGYSDNPMDRLIHDE